MSVYRGPFDRQGWLFWRGAGSSYDDPYCHWRWVYSPMTEEPSKALIHELPECWREAAGGPC